MKISRSLIIGALLGYISAVDLEKHHHHHNYVQLQRQHHYPSNIGVRFVQTADEGAAAAPAAPADAPAPKSAGDAAA